MSKCLVVAAALVALAAPAFAADVAAPAVTYDWSGPYIGAQVGYGWARDHIRDSEHGVPNVSDYDDHFNMDGGIGGVFAGYNFQRDNLVFGAEADAEIAGVNGDNSAWPFGDSMTAKVTAQGSLRGRIGYAFDSSLVYFTGGLAIANIKTRYQTGPNVDSFSSTHAGWTVGVGVEHAFTPNWIVRAEYRYSDFGTVTDWTQTADPFTDYHNSITEHAVRISLAYKF